jgi:hypothetical protein
LYPFKKGVKLMDTFSLTETGEFMTDDPNFAVVSLRQGADATQNCTVNLEILIKKDLRKIEDIESLDDWMSQSESN